MNLYAMSVKGKMVYLPEQAAELQVLRNLSIFSDHSWEGVDMLSRTIRPDLETEAQRHT